MAQTEGYLARKQAEFEALQLEIATFKPLNEDETNSAQLMP